MDSIHTYTWCKIYRNDINGAKFTETTSMELAEQGNIEGFKYVI
jgi:hypothetical protein